MPDERPTQPTDPNAPHHGERPPFAPPFVQGLGQPRYGQPAQFAQRNEQVPAWRQSWVSVLSVIALVVLILVALSWWQLS